MPTTASAIYSNLKLEPQYDADLARQRAVNIEPSQTIAHGTILGELAGTDAVQTVTINGGPTGGTYTLTFGGQTTSALAYNASAATIAAALAALSTIGAGNIKASGSGPFAVTFIEALGNGPVSAVTATYSGLTGGTSPTVTIAQTTAGVNVSAGTFGPYASSNTDGTQIPKAISAYDIVTDSSGNVTLSATAGQVIPPVAGATEKTAAVYVCGVFRSTDLVGLDANAVTVLCAHWEQGNVSDGGILRIP